MAKNQTTSVSYGNTVLPPEELARIFREDHVSNDWFHGLSNLVHLNLPDWFKPSRKLEIYLNLYTQARHI